MSELTWNLKVVLRLFLMQNPQNPLEDFAQTPPGVLALHNILYFAKVNAEQYTKV